MNKRKVPERVCISCREKKGRDELVRIIKTKEGEISLDLSHKKSGRGAYVCKTAQCIKKAKEKNLFSRALKAKVPDEILDSLEENEDE